MNELKKIDEVIFEIKVGDVVMLQCRLIDFIEPSPFFEGQLTMRSFNIQPQFDGTMRINGLGAMPIFVPMGKTASIKIEG